MQFVFQVRFTTPFVLVAIIMTAGICGYRGIATGAALGCSDDCDRTETALRTQPDTTKSIEALTLSDGTGESLSEYRLGPGDLLDIQVFAAEEYSGEVIVTQDGSINLPQVGKIMVEGLTIQQAIATISNRYAEFIRTPIVSIQPLRFRPVRIGIAGEVKRPGSYIASSLDTFDASSRQEGRFPTLTQVISQAGGITADANLRAIEIRRDVGRNQEAVISVDLWSLVIAGNLEQDPILLSGDEVLIPTATDSTPEELNLLSSASFAPDTIQVYVAGEVAAPGMLEVPLNTSLNQVLLAAGGFTPRANRSHVDLLRVNPNGTVENQAISVDLATDIAATNNPVLKDQDVIVVNRSGLAQTGDFTNILLSPVTRVFNILFGIDRFLE